MTTPEQLQLKDNIELQEPMKDAYENGVSVIDVGTEIIRPRFLEMLAGQLAAAEGDVTGWPASDCEYDEVSESKFGEITDRNLFTPTMGRKGTLQAVLVTKGVGSLEYLDDSDSKPSAGTQSLKPGSLVIISATPRSKDAIWARYDMSEDAELTYFMNESNHTNLQERKIDIDSYRGWDEHFKKDKIKKSGRIGKKFQRVIEASA